MGKTQSKPSFLVSEGVDFEARQEGLRDEAQKREPYDNVAKDGGYIESVPNPVPGRPAHQYHSIDPVLEVSPYMSSATLKRRATEHNPWKSVRSKTMRQRKVSGIITNLIDPEARKQPWYTMHFDRESALAILEENLDKLPNGAFVVCRSGRDFATLCMVTDGQLYNVSVANEEESLLLKITGKKEPPKFSTLSGLVEFYTGKGKGLPYPLNPAGIREDMVPLFAKDTEAPVYDVGHAAGPRQAVPGYANASPSSTYDTAPKNVAYSNAAPSSGPAEYNNPNQGPAEYTHAAPSSVQYVEASPSSAKYAQSPTEYDNTGAKSPQSAKYDVAYLQQQQQQQQQKPGASYTNASPGSVKYADPDHPPVDGYMQVGDEGNEPGHEGFISISKTSFDAASPIRGTTFTPLQNNEWFFIGLSDTTINYHGKKDKHYDDIDYCIFCMGSGKATAREQEDEVGPYVSYQAGDVFTVRVSKKGTAVEYLLNGKVFYTSARAPTYPLHVVQAFHPTNLGMDLVMNCKWI